MEAVLKPFASESESLPASFIHICPDTSNVHSTSDPSSSQSSEQSRDFGEGEGTMSLKRISRCSCEAAYTLCIGERMGDENCGKGTGEVGDVGRCPGVGPSDTVERVHVNISLMISMVGVGGEVFSSSLGDRSK